MGRLASRTISRPIRRAAARSGSRSRTTTNSSPPKRVTPSPTRATRRVDTTRSSSSPEWCPSESLTAFRWSRSRNSTAADPSSLARSRADPMRSMRPARFGRWVSVSWVACSSSSSTADWSDSPRRRLSLTVSDCRTNASATSASSTTIAMASTRPPRAASATVTTVATTAHIAGSAATTPAIRWWASGRRTDFEVPRATQADAPSSTKQPIQAVSTTRGNSLEEP